MNSGRAGGGWSAAVMPAALAVLSGAGFALVYVLTVRTTPGREFSDASLRGAVLTHSGVAHVVDGVLGVVSVATLLAGAAAISLIALARLRRMPGLVAVGLLMAANASAWLLKHHVLSRPDLGLHEIGPVTRNSLPSGHTTAVFSVVVALLFVVPASWRRAVGVIGGGLAVLMGLATMSAGWHRAGDSISAVLLVGCWAGISVLVVVVAGGVNQASAPTYLTVELTTRRLLTMPVGAAAIGGGLAVGLVLFRPLRASTAGAVSAFLAGGLLITAVTFLVVGSVLSVLTCIDATTTRT